MFTRLIRRLRAIARHGALDREMRAEMDAHLARATERFMARGLSRREAELEARREFGNVAVIQEEGRDARGTRWMDDTVADVRFALRHFSRRRTFALSVVLVLSIGLGVNAALLSLAQAVTMRPAPGVPDDDRLVRIRGIERPDPTSRRRMRGFSRDEIALLAAERGVFTSVAGWADDRVALDLRDGSEPTPIGAQFVTPGFFQTIGLVPSFGPGLRGESGGAPDQSVVLGRELWEERFAGANVVGKMIDINGVPMRIAGVAPRRFRGPTSSGAAPLLWIPMANRAAMQLDSAPLSAVGRLAPGSSIEQATTVAKRVAQLHAPEKTAEWTADAVRLRGETDLQQQEQALAGGVLLGTVTLLILLVTCSNVSALLVGAAVSRRHEIAVRLSLGASRRRVVRQLLTESALLALGGGLVGLLFYSWLVRLLAAQMPGHELAPDLLTAAGAMLFAIATGMVFGLSPALHATRGDVARALRDSAAATTGKARLQRAFVVAQIVFTQPLLVVLAMMLVTFVSSGVSFPSDARLMQARFGIWDSRGEPTRGAAQATAVMRRVVTTPGVVAATNDAAGFANVTVTVPPADRGNGERRDEPVLVHVEGASPDYFPTLGIPMLRGRNIEWRDTLDARMVPVVIGSDFARSVWGNVDPVGRHLAGVVPGRGTTAAEGMVVVGVYDATKPTTRGGEVRAFTAFGRNWRAEQFLVRTAGPARAQLPDVKKLVGSVPGLPLLSLETITDVGQSMRDDALHISLGAAAAGALALLLASVGLYGVVALAVGQRRREIGVRIALGASPLSVARLFFRSGIRLSALGLVIGLPASLIGVRATVQFVDAPVISTGAIAAAISVVVLAVASLATWIPARRATRVDAAITLRAD